MENNTQIMVNLSNLQQFTDRMPKMMPGSWGERNERFCMMSAIVNGAKNPKDCIVAGWPAWFSYCIPTIYDSNVRGIHKIAVKESNEWAFEVIRQAANPIDYNSAFTCIIESFLQLIRENTGPGASRIKRYISHHWNRFEVYTFKDTATYFNEALRALKQSRRPELATSHLSISLAEFLNETIPNNPLLPHLLYRLIELEQIHTHDKQNAIRKSRQIIIDAMVTNTIANREPSYITNNHDPLFVIGVDPILDTEVAGVFSVR